MTTEDNVTHWHLLTDNRYSGSTFTANPAEVTCLNCRYTFDLDTVEPPYPVLGLTPEGLAQRIHDLATSLEAALERIERLEAKTRHWAVEIQPEETYAPDPCPPGCPLGNVGHRHYSWPDHVGSIIRYDKPPAPSPVANLVHLHRSDDLGDVLCSRRVVAEVLGPHINTDPDGFGQIVYADVSAVTCLECLTFYNEHYPRRRALSWMQDSDGHVTPGSVCWVDRPGFPTSPRITGDINRLHRSILARMEREGIPRGTDHPGLLAAGALPLSVRPAFAGVWTVTDSGIPDLGVKVEPPDPEQFEPCEAPPCPPVDPIGPADRETGGDPPASPHPFM